MKKLIGFALLTMSLNVLAANAPAKNAHKNANRNTIAPQAAGTVAPAATEETVMTQITEQILATVDRAAIDINARQISFSNLKNGGEPGISLNDVELKSRISLTSNLEVNLLQARPKNPDSNSSSQLQKVSPKLFIDTKGLIVAFDVKLKKSGDKAVATFYRLDPRTKQPAPSPITFKTTTANNKDLFTIRLYSLEASRIADAQEPKKYNIVGSCLSDKIVLDFASGKTKEVPVNCEFSGIMTDEGYKLDFTYAD